MKKIFAILLLLSTLLTIGCAKKPETPVDSDDSTTTEGDSTVTESDPFTFQLGPTNAFGSKPDLQEIKIDAVKDEKKWEELAPLTSSLEDGRVSAKVWMIYTDGGVYFFFDIADTYGVRYSIVNKNKTYVGDDLLRNQNSNLFICLSGNKKLYIVADAHNFVPHSKYYFAVFNGATRKVEVDGVSHLQTELYVTWEDLGGVPSLLTLRAEYNYLSGASFKTMLITNQRSSGVIGISSTGFALPK